MYVETSFHTLESHQRLAHYLAIDSVSQGNGRSRNGILDIHPSRYADLAVPEYIASVMQVESEISAFIFPDSFCMEIRSYIVIGIGKNLGLSILRADVEPDFLDDRTLSLSRESLECFDYMCLVTIDVQMVRIHGGNNGY